MPTVAALGTSYNLPNYHGRVHPLTPSDTPFATALMGTAQGGGEVSASRTFEWQTTDLRAAGQNVVVDGDRAGTPSLRSRENVFNVLQTHREDVDVAYERLAQIGQYDGQNIDGGNPVTDEAAFQITEMWKQIKRDIEFSLINGTYQLPSDNDTAAQTRGILSAIATNVVDGGNEPQAGTAAATGDLVTVTAHGYVTGDDIRFTSLTGGTGLTANVRYYVKVASANTFTVALTPGGADVSITVNYSELTAVKYGTPTEETVGDVMQSAFDNGGLQESEMGLIIVNSGLRRWLTKVYVTAKDLEVRTRSVGGARVEVITTDFGDLGIMLNRYMPQGTLATVSLDQCKPWFRSIPGKGTMFAEPTSKAGASEATQLYTSIGLEYGNEAAHGKVLNLTATAPRA